MPLFRSRSSSRENMSQNQELEVNDSNTMINTKESEIESITSETAQVMSALDDMDIDPYTKSCYKKMTKDPLGQHLLSITQDLARLYNKNGWTMNTDMHSLSKDICQEKSQTRMILDSLQQEIQNHKCSKIHGDLCESIIEPPTKFASRPQLIGQTILEARQLFPGGERRNQFNGSSDESKMTITEYLIAMNNAQEKLKLTEEEFIQQLLAGTTGSAHTKLLGWVNLDHSIGQLYQMLLSTYNRTLQPHIAENQLKYLVGLQSQTTIDLENKIMELASTASLSIPKESRQAIFNHWACQALINSLPEASRSFVAHEFRRAASQLGRNPPFVTLQRIIAPHRAELDRDLKRNGVPPETFYNYRYRERAHNPRINLIEDQGQQRQSRNFNPRRTRDSFSRSPSRDHPTSERQTYCTLCGSTYHTAASGCPNMKNAAGEIVNTAPFYETCDECPQNIKRKLHHPEELCIFRAEVKPFISIKLLNFNLRK